MLDTYSTVVAGDMRSGIRSRCRNMQRTVVLKHMHLAGHSAAADDENDDNENTNSKSSDIGATIVFRKTAVAASTRRRRTKWCIERVIVRTGRTALSTLPHSRTCRCVTKYYGTPHERGRRDPLRSRGFFSLKNIAFFFVLQCQVFVHGKNWRKKLTRAWLL